METIEAAGREWTVAEAEAVVAFVEGGGLGPWPRGICCSSAGRGLLVDAGDVDPVLTREHVGALRDFCRPWVESVVGTKKNGVLPGELLKRRRAGMTYTMTDLTLGRGERIAVLNGVTVTVKEFDTVLVRRPRKPALTLADLKPRVLLSGPHEGDRVEVCE